ncbi:MAG: NAD-dependent epimerase/dehydratase family protein [Marmoricola sp.]|nr:NAD-dependent epimerase/dehydratase family protein [Marmoricola sp.]
MSENAPEPGLTVAVTGPTGEIGIAFLQALERSERVAVVRGMARRPFDPGSKGLSKTEYVQGDVLDREAIDRLVDGADVVVHLAFLIFGDPEQSREINLTGSRNVFEATAAAGSKRLVYTSSVAAYGFHASNPLPLHEDLGPAGTEDFYYSAQKAELEATLRESLEGTEVEAYVFRPSIVGGPDSPALVTNVPYVGTPSLVPSAVRALLDRLPQPGPVILDPGTPMQIVHADDVADALVKAVEGVGVPGCYNLAAEGEFTMSDLARELGWRSVPVPDLAVDLTAALVKRLPAMPSQAAWIQTARISVVMDTTRARDVLGWQPRHDATATLRATVEGAQAAGLVTATGRRGS